MPNPLAEAAQRVFDLALERGHLIATAESCTGGMVAMAITDIAGSSQVFDRAFVTYSNAAKTEMLGVPEQLIAEHGAVSATVAVRMVEGALRFSSADIAVAITGIAGPGGSTDTKAVGLVYIAAAFRDGQVALQELNFGNIGRGAVRERSAIEALKAISRLMEESSAVA